MYRKQNAFSLVELSIVLVIIGLLAGGVLSGQALIRAAALRAVTREYEQYQTGVQSFRDQYMALPGDMTNAATFWGAADGVDGNQAACFSAIGTGTATCNGDGSGTINTTGTSAESFRFWQHLANAGLVTGRFTGVQDGTSADSATAKNSAQSRLSNGLWYASTFDQTLGDASIFDGDGGTGFELGKAHPNRDPETPILNPEEAWNIDTKMDDGKPGRGTITARDVVGFTGTNCTTADESLKVDAAYNLQQTQIDCVLYFKNIF